MKYELMKEWLNKLWNPQAKNASNDGDHRYVVLANRIAVIIVAAVCVFESVLLLFDTPYGLQTLLFTWPLAALALVPWVNTREHHTLGRIFLSLYFPFYLVTVSVAMSHLYPGKIASYYNPRIALLLCSLIPFLLFDTKKWLPIALSLTFSLVSTILFNPILNLLSKGFFQQSIDQSTYYNSDVVFSLVFIMLSGMALSLKTLLEKTERHLREKNYELIEVNNEVATQNEEIMAQAEMLKLSEEHVQAAKKTIEAQNVELEQHNINLEEIIEQKKADLLSTNEELIKYNNELLQFSFTISHNLRGPVARLIGLTNLMDMEGDSSEINSRIKASAFELDFVLKDLSRIIDIRNDIYRIREKISFEHEWLRIKGNFEDQLGGKDCIQLDFQQAPWVVSIRPLVNSILYNLVSNAVKYRPYDRPLEVTIKTIRNDNFIQLKVKDNGLGINLNEHGKDIFKLYKRFHTHKEGKGLGLYLVKTQAEIMGGYVEVKSEENTGSEFTIYFKMHNEKDAQLCFSEPYASVYYHAWLSTLEFKWTGEPSLKELEIVLERGKEILANYKAAYLISDIRERAEISQEEQFFALEKIFPAVFQTGVTKVFILQRIEKIGKTSQEVLQTILKEPRITVLPSREAALGQIENHL